MSLRPGKEDESAPVEGIWKSKDGGLTKKILKEGTGEVIPTGVVARVHYTGRLTNGKVFDSSVTRGTPFTFNIGAREVILGWDKGVATMRKNEKCVLTCKPEYAYGSQGVGPIPANATLEFEVELLDWHEKEAGSKWITLMTPLLFSVFFAIVIYSLINTRKRESNTW